MNARVKQVLAACVVATAAACSKAPASTAAAGRPSVTVAPVVEVPIADTLELVGRTEAVQRVEVRARVQGVLEEKAFEDGQYVEQDDLLFRIERATYEVALAAAEATRSRAEARFAQAESYRKRLESVKAGGVAPSDLEAAVHDAALARADLDAAAASVAAAELDLGYTEVRAPISGRVGRTQLTVGNLVGPDTGPLLTINQLDPIYVTYAASETEYVTRMRARLAAGRPVPGAKGQDVRSASEFVPHIKLADGRAYDHPGRVVFFDNGVDSSTGTIILRAEFPNPDSLLLPGQYVSVEVVRSEPTLTRLVPQAAVMQDQQGRSVLVVDGEGKVESRRVTLGDVHGPDWVVQDGLEPGETVIVSGLEKVRPGVLVDTMPLPTAPSGS
ncbi:MAG: efflux RND transporter periplasmic adaptor subunit [Planctomycetes bacterium]|nr:efflux RND transporter periplasmic adaptor subunit [Planctomycetota bacterium]